MAYVVTGLDPTGALAGARAETYREAMRRSQGWTNVVIKPAQEQRQDYGPEQQNSEVAHALLATFPTNVYQAIAGSHAYGALVYRITECAADRRITVREVLDALADDDLGYAATRAQDPAAFLASKVRDLT